MRNMLKIAGPVLNGSSITIGRNGFQLTAPPGSVNGWNLWLEGGLNNPDIGYKWLPVDRSQMQ